MSSNVANLVPILDGTNYRQWAIAMKAFVMSQGLWAFVDGSHARPYLPTKEDELKAIKKEDQVEIRTMQTA